VINRIQGYNAPSPSASGGEGVPGDVAPAPSSSQIAIVGCLGVFFLIMTIALVGQVAIKIAEIIWGGA
jgi:hypothetical protein